MVPFRGELFVSGSREGTQGEHHLFIPPHSNLAIFTRQLCAGPVDHGPLELYAAIPSYTFVFLDYPKMDGI